MMGISDNLIELNRARRQPVEADVLTLLPPGAEPPKVLNAQAVNIDRACCSEVARI